MTKDSMQTLRQMFTMHYADKLKNLVLDPRIFCWQYYQYMQALEENGLPPDSELNAFSILSKRE